MKVGDVVLAESRAGWDTLLLGHVVAETARLSGGTVFMVQFIGVEDPSGAFVADFLPSADTDIRNLMTIIENLGAL